MFRAVAITGAILAATPALSEPRLSLSAEYAGMREYYCQTRGVLQNLGEGPLTELNGFFLIYLNGEQVGRSRGASFLNVAPGESVEAIFEAPNAPCAEDVSYEFVVGACRIDTSFADQALCAAAIEITGRIEQARAP